MEDWKDYSATIKSCAIAFLCVCEFHIAKGDMENIAKGRWHIDDFLDANQVLLDVIENHGISTELSDDGEMPQECDHIFRAAYDMTIELNRKKHTIVATESNYQYSLADLQSSINDICAQWHSAKIDTKEAKSLVKNCCAKFLEDNK